jgi:response regulator of citrate/malate metabolism
MKRRKQLTGCIVLKENFFGGPGSGDRDQRDKSPARAREGAYRPQTTPRDIPAIFLRQHPQYKNGAFNLTELARLCGISRTTAYKYIGLLEA